MISSIASISSSSSATVRVEKATSEFLMGPDWTMNIDICDTINTNQTLAKDVVKAVKKRLQHKNPKVQLLALTLLETMVKNCGDYVHFQIAERNILQHMVKIVKKRTDMHVRDKVLELIGSWYVAFGGSQGRYPQYFMAYEDLRRFGIEFPKRSADATAIFTPPVTHPISKHPLPGYGMPSSSSTRLDEAMAADNNFSLSNINSMRDVLDLLTDMLQAVDPSDRLAVKDEVVVDLIEQCRANQKKLMEVLATSGVEELLFQGLELNDDLRSVLARHDAIASGSPLPLPQVTNPEAGGSEKYDSSPEPADISIHKATASIAKPADVSAHNAATSNAKPSAAVVPADGSIDEEEEDDFALLARRHSKPYHHNGTTSSETPSSPVTSNALVPVTPAHVQTKEQDIIDDLLSITLSTSASTEHTTPMPLGVTFSSEAYPGKPGLAYNHYVASWAQAQPQAQFQSHPPYSHPQQQFSSQPQPQFQHQPLGHSESPHVTQPAQQHYSSEYPPPPWATTPSYFTNQNPVSKAPQTYSTPPRPLHNDLLSVNGQTQVNYSVSSTAAPNAGQKPFIPSYRLFEDLDVFGNGDGRFRAKSKGPQSLSGSESHSMVGGRK